MRPKSFVHTSLAKVSYSLARISARICLTHICATKKYQMQFEIINDNNTSMQIHHNNYRRKGGGGGGGGGGVSEGG